MRRKTGKKTGKATTMVSPRSGASCPTGAHAKNTGGKPGRSGRRPDVFREELARIRDIRGLPLVEKLLSGEVEITLRGRCSHCGRVSRGPTPSAAVRMAASPDTQIRVLEMLCKHTLPAEKVIRIDGIRKADLVFETIKERIAARLGPSESRELIDDINLALQQHR